MKLNMISDLIKTDTVIYKFVKPKKLKNTSK